MKPNRIVICRDEYETEPAFKKAIGDAVNILLDANYAINTFYDDKGFGIVCIDFDHKDENLASLYPYWLTLDEADLIDETRREQRINGNYNE